MIWVVGAGVSALAGGWQQTVEGGDWCSGRQVRNRSAPGDGSVETVRERRGCSAAPEARRLARQVGVFATQQRHTGQPAAGWGHRPLRRWRAWTRPRRGRRQRTQRPLPPQRAPSPPGPRRSASPGPVRRGGGGRGVRRLGSRERASRGVASGYKQGCERLCRFPTSNPSSRPCLAPTRGAPHLGREDPHAHDGQQDQAQVGGGGRQGAEADDHELRGRGGEARGRG